MPSGQQPLLDAGEVAAVPLLDAGATAQAVDAGEADVAEVQPAQAPPAKHDIMASKRAVQSPDGHFNFWRAEELRADNAEARVGALDAGNTSLPKYSLLVNQIRCADCECWTND